MLAPAEKDTKPGTGHNAFRFLTIATAVTLTINIIFWCLPASFNKTIYGTIQFIWPSLSLLILMGIHFNSADKNTKFAARILGTALVPWTATLVLWSIVLPQLYDTDLAYYVTGFGFLASYIILAYGLASLKRSRQWYIDPSRDLYLKIITVMVIIGLSAFILSNIKLDSPRLPDIFILFLYLVMDTIMLSYVVKLLYMSLNDDLKYIVLVIGEFVFINSIADLIFEMRWLFSLNNIYSVKTAQVTDFIYNISLVFMVAALMMYNSKFKSRAMDEVNKKLHDTKHLMDSVVMQSPDAMCICGPDGTIILVNDAFLKLFGVQRSDILGNHNIYDNISGLEDWMAPLASKLRAGEPFFIPNISLKPRNSDGRVNVSIKAFPVLGGDNVISSYVFNIEDITEWLRIEKDLLESKKQAELYVDLMAHDINNMNQVALGFLELAEDRMLSDGNLGVEQRGLLLKPIESLINSSALIDNVKKLQKEKSGLLGNRLMDVGEVLNEVKKQYESVPGRAVSIDYSDGSDCRVMANDLLKEVFSNLVGNAVKHSNNPVNININSSCIYENGKKFCRIEVTDDGPGIPDSIKRQIFDRRGDERGIALPRGKGLGLYLVNTLVSDYNGKIWVEDRVSGDHTKGSRFVVLLPAL